MFYVRVKPSKVREVCTSTKKIWVVDGEYSFYVEKSKRGSWNTREEAESCITEKREEVVEEL